MHVPWDCAVSCRFSGCEPWCQPPIVVAIMILLSIGVTALALKLWPKT